MKKLTLITICAILCACTSQIPKPIPGAKCDFTYSISGKVVEFKNASTTGLKAAIWYYGDDTYNENMEVIKHKYNADGSYRVVLECKDSNGYKYSCEKTITIGGGSQGGGSDQPVTYKVYLKGFKVYDLPYTRETYRFKCNIYDWNGVAVSALTDNQDIKKSDLASQPKTITFANPKYITTSDRFYIDYTAVEVVVTYLYGGGWKEVFRQSLTTEKELKEYYFVNGNGNIEVSAILDYQQQ